MITIRALLDFEELGIRVIAGEGGLGNRVTWAHVSELEDPTPWLDGGELLMTTGIGIPRVRARQVAYIRRLIDRRVAGLAIGDNMHAPTLAPAMLDAAQAASFPVVLVRREVPFIALAKTVAAANRDAMLRRLATHLRVYETLHQVARHDADPVNLFERLADVTGYKLFLLTPSGEPLFPGLPELPEADPASIAECLGRSEPTPVRVSNGASTCYLVPIVARHRQVGVLAAMADELRESDHLALHHVATIAGLVAVELLHERERLRRAGGERLLRYVSDPARFPGGLAALFDDPPVDSEITVAAVALDGPSREWDTLHHTLSDASCRHVLARRGRLGYVVACTRPGYGAKLEELLAMSQPNYAIGLSGPHPAQSGGERAFEEACAALRSAIIRGTHTATFDTGSPVLSLELDVAALSRMVETVLGELIAYDARAGTELYATLKTFLEHDRNLKTASIALSIHRQTLVYRLKRIEQLTSRSTSRTADVCDLWMAIRAREALLATHAAEPGPLAVAAA